MKKKFLLVLLLSLALSGCVPTIGNTSSGTNKDEFKKGAYVSGFPAVPYYENSKVLESYGYKGSYGSASVTKDEITKVVEFFSESLKPLGWDYTVNQKSTDNYEFQISNSSQQGSIIVNKTAEGQKTGITISVSPR